MFKAKIALFLTTLTLSISASAGWVQYTLEDTFVSNGASVTGFVIQDATDRSIAFYEFDIAGSTDSGMIHMTPSGIFNNITSASNTFPGSGPSNFTLFDQLAGDYAHEMGFDFQGTSTVGRYSLSGWRTQSPMMADPDLHVGSFDITGFITRSAVQDPQLLAALQASEDDGALLNGLRRIVPAAAVPEPGTLALLALGGLGLALRRRRISL